MKTVFADTSYYIALLNRNDEHASAAREYTARFDGTFVTTAWVIAEVANYLREGANRALFLSLLADLKDDYRVCIVPPTEPLFNRGVQLFADRPDKDWSLTDCISLVVMQDHGLAEAATTDHHFEQAGFNAILRHPVQ
jgi:predicted nucleic acid-binding protein